MEYYIAVVTISICLIAISLGKIRGEVDTPITVWSVIELVMVVLLSVTAVALAGSVAVVFL